MQSPVPFNRSNVSKKCEPDVGTTNITYNFITLQADSSVEDYEQDASRHKYRA